MKYLQYFENQSSIDTSKTYTSPGTVAVRSTNEVIYADFGLNQGYKLKIESGKVISYDSNSYTITLSATTGGSVSGGGTYHAGSTATIVATPDSGYRFVQWSDGDTNATRNIVVNSDITLTATFEIATYTVTLTAGTGGTVSGGGTYAAGTVVTIKATANLGYGFVKWSDGDTNATRNIVVNSDIALTATFKQYTVYYTVSLYADDYDLGCCTVSGGGTYAAGTTITISTSDTCGFCTWVKWSDGNTNKTRQITVNSNISLTAYWDLT